MPMMAISIPELCRLREKGTGIMEVRNQASNYWSKRNNPHTAQRFDESLVKSSESIVIPGQNMKTVEQERGVRARRCAMKRKHVESASSASTSIDSNSSKRCKLLTDVSTKEPLLGPSNFRTNEEIVVGQCTKKLPSLVKKKKICLLGGHVLAYSVKKDCTWQIPSLKSSNKTQPVPQNSGIHALHANPSQSLLATGGVNPADVAVYRLPDYEPVTIGENGHQDWIFAMQWIDDSHLVSGSRDSSVALWKFVERPDDAPCAHMPHVRLNAHTHYPTTRPIVKKVFPNVEKVRSLVYSYRRQLLLLDVERFSQVKSLHMRMQSESPYDSLIESVCMCHSPDENLLAVGGRQRVAIYESVMPTSRPLFVIKLPPSALAVNHNGLPWNVNISYNTMAYGARSISWHGNMITLGTAASEVLFYDVRAQKYLDCEGCGKETKLTVSSSQAENNFILSDELLIDMFADGGTIPQAVYTHNYDKTRTQLFTAGGPIAASIQGSFASIWR